MTAPAEVVTAAALAAGTATIARYAVDALRPVWVAATAPLQLKAALLDVIPALLEEYGSAAATLAADWYDDYRDAAEVPGRFTAIPAEVGDRGSTELISWAISPLFDAEPNLPAAQTLLAGGLQRRITNVARDTIVGSSLADPAAEGWQRTGVGSCAFCRMLIARGAVYTEATADFASHDWCNCGAAPAFGGKPRPVKPYTPSSRNITAADRARVREYLRTH